MLYKPKNSSCRLHVAQTICTVPNSTFTASKWHRVHLFKLRSLVRIASRSSIRQFTDWLWSQFFQALTEFYREEQGNWFNFYSEFEIITVDNYQISPSLPKHKDWKWYREVKWIKTNNEWEKSYSLLKKQTTLKLASFSKMNSHHCKSFSEAFSLECVQKLIHYLESCQEQCVLKISKRHIDVSWSESTCLVWLESDRNRAK